MILNLFKNPGYICSVLAVANVLMFLSAISLYAPGYAMLVLGSTKTKVNIFFMGSILTSPTLGAIMGGIITDKCIGSYADKRALVMCLSVYAVFVALCVSGPFVNNDILFFSVLWLAIFAQGFIQPVMMGIILNCVSPVQRPTASSLGNLIMTGVGYMTGPLIYGAMLDLFPTDPRSGMKFAFWSVSFGLVCLIIAVATRKESLKKDVRRTTRMISQMVSVRYTHMEAANE